MKLSKYLLVCAIALPTKNDTIFAEVNINMQISTEKINSQKDWLKNFYSEEQAALNEEFESFNHLVGLSTTYIGNLIDCTTLYYENITNEMKKRKKGSSNKYAAPDPYDPQSQGSINNPYIEKRIDPTTSVIDDTKVIQRSDGSWVALTADEHKQLTDKLTADGIPIDKVSRISPSQDMFEQQQLQNNNGVGVVNPNNPNVVNTTTTTTPTQGTTIPADVQAELDLQKEIQKQMPYGGRVNIKRPDEAQYADAMKVYKANEDAKKARYDAMVNEVQQYNSAADYENAKRQGYIPGTREYTSQEFKDFYGYDSMDSSGNHGLYVTKMQAPPAYAAGELPEKKYNTVEVFKPYPMDAHVGLPIWGNKSYNSNFDELQYSLFSTIKDALLNPLNYSTIRTELIALNAEAFDEWEPTTRNLELYGADATTNSKYRKGAYIYQGNWSVSDLFSNIINSLQTDKGSNLRYENAKKYFGPNGSYLAKYSVNVGSNGEIIFDQGFTDAIYLVYDVALLFTTGRNPTIESMIPSVCSWAAYGPMAADKNMKIVYSKIKPGIKDCTGISNSFSSWLACHLTGYIIAAKFGK